MIGADNDCSADTDDNDDNEGDNDDNDTMMMM